MEQKNEHSKCVWTNETVVAFGCEALALESRDWDKLVNPRLLDPGPALAFRFDSDPAQDQIFLIKFDGNLWPSCKWVPIYFK